MKFGVREICDVVFRAKSARKIGSRQFFKNEPVLYFDSLKTSSLEGAVTTVYAQGGRGNARLVSWDGERTLTFTMEDALISDIGLSILASANLIDATTAKPINVHATTMMATTGLSVTGGKLEIALKGEDDKDLPIHIYDPKYSVTDFVADDTTPDQKYDYKATYTENTNVTEFGIYVMFLKNGEIFTEPYYARVKAVTGAAKAHNTIVIGEEGGYTPTDLAKDFGAADQVLIDYYVMKPGGATQIDITPETFGGNFYIEASTLFRDQVSGIDMPAEFVIPNGKVQSNFTFSLASSGDPSTFTFTVDALPDYTRFDKSKKVLAALQVITEDIDLDTKRATTAFKA